MGGSDDSEVNCLRDHGISASAIPVIAEATPSC